MNMNTLKVGNVTLNVGDMIYRNWSEPFDYDDFCITTIDEIIDEDGEITIIDSDGDEFTTDEVNVEFFMSAEDARNDRKRK